MNFGNYELSFKKKQEEIQVEAPRGDNEVSFADSSYYDKYQLKPYNPADLYQKTGDYSTYDKMVTDDQVSSVLALKKIITLNSNWIIETENEEVQEFLTDCLNKYLDDTFIKKMYEILSAMEYGFSVTEKIFEPIDTDYGKKVVFTKLKTRAPHTFELHTDVHGNLEKLLQHTGNGEIILKPNKFIIYSYNKKFDNPYGVSDLNIGVYRAWWSKDAIIKFWNIFLERHGMPTLIGKIPQGLGESERSQLKEIFRNIQSKTGIVIPNTVELDKIEAGNGAGEYEKAVDKYNLMISRALLLPDLMGFSGGQTSGGSFSLGQEQFDVFYKTIDYIRQDITKLINREIIQPLLRWNYGANEYAEFKFHQVDHEKKDNDMRMWLDAVKAGKIPVTDQHINWFLEQVDAPEIEQAELDKINEEKEEMRQQIQDGDNEKDKKPGDKDSGAVPGDGKGDKDTEDDSKKFERSFLSRRLTVYEKKVDFNKIDSDWQEVTSEYKKKLADGFTLVINGLLDDIRKKKIIEKRALQLINKLEIRNYRKIDKLFRDMLNDSYGVGIASAEIPKKFAIGTPVGLDNEDVALWLEQNAFYISNVEKETILKRAKGILLDSIRSGSGIRETNKQLSDAFSDYNIQIGRTELESATRVETIVRTNVQKAFNEARAKRYTDNADEIKAYQYSAILDGRQSALCESLDEKIFKPSELEYYNPPNHYRCRSVVVPIFNDEELEGFSDMPATEQNNGSFLTIKK